nr:mitochondrial E3 ubiquitin protein ligase 1-like [Hydra vulgaris]
MLPRMEESKWYQLLIFFVEYSAVLEDPIPDEDQMNFDPDNLWGISVPAVCALMTSKSETLYKLVFSKIKEVLDFSPATIMSDFERGLQNALKTTWSESLVNGCSGLDENSMKEDGESLPLPTSTSTESPKCVVCTVNERNALVMPCRHFLFCQPCIQQVQKSNKTHCPTCRGPLSSIIEPFQ